MTQFQDSDLIRYIVEHALQPGDQLPPLDKLSSELKISTGKLREQLEVARIMGFVEVKPRTGIRVADFNFSPAVRFSLLYALAIHSGRFESFSELRNHVEFAFFHEAVSLLTNEDCTHLKMLVERAWARLEGNPIRIPHPEHRDLHLTIFKRLDNPFVRGVLEAYWDAYESEGFSVFSDYDYLHEVWTYHEGIVNAIVAGDVDEAYRLLVQHTKLLQKRPKARSRNNGTPINSAGTAQSSNAQSRLDRQRNPATTNK
jgi:DNA-binding FadR family transcriptional regulator